jgi:hypothetical protein
MGQNRESVGVSSSHEFVKSVNRMTSEPTKRRAPDLARLFWRSFPFLVLTLTSLIEFRSFFHSGFISVGDFTAPSPWYVNHGEVSIFSSAMSGGAYNLGLSAAPVEYLLSLGSSVWGAELVYRVFFVLIPLLAGSSMILLLKHMFGGSKLGTVALTVGGLVYAVNPWILTEGILPGHFDSLGLAYALTPLFVYFLMRFVETGKLSDGGIAALSLSAIFAASDYEALILFPGVLVLGLVFAPNRAPGGVFRGPLTAVGMTLAVYVTAAAVGAYWIAPSISLLISGVNYQWTPITPALLQSTSQFAITTNNLRLLGYGSAAFSFGLFQTGNRIADALYLTSSYLLAFCGLTPLVFKKAFRWPDQRVWVFLSVTLVFYLLLSQGTQVLGDAYYTASTVIPFLDDPILFLSWLALVYAITIPILIQRLLSNGDHVTWSRFVIGSRIGGIVNRAARVPLRTSRTRRVIVVTIVVGVVLVSSWPAWTGNFNGGYEPLQQPIAYQESYVWLAEHAGENRTLWLPATGVYAAFNWSSRFGYDTVTDPVRWQTQSPLLNPQFGSIETNVANQFIDQVQQMLYDGSSSNIGSLLSAADVEYLAVRTDGASQAFGTDLLNASYNESDLMEAWHSGPITIFKVSEPTTQILVESNLTVAYGGFSFLASLPWFGYSPQQEAVVLPELVPSTQLQGFLENPQDGVIQPDFANLSLLSSLIPEQYWVALPTIAGPWFPDSYAGVAPGSAIYPDAVSTYSNASLAIRFLASAPGPYVVSLRLLGGFTDYNISIDGKPEIATAAETPPQGFEWSEYRVFLDPGQHQLEVQPRSPGYNSIDSAIVTPLAVLNEAISTVSKLVSEGKLTTVFGASTLYPGPDVTWNNLYQSRTPAPYKFGLNFPVAVKGVATASGAFQSAGGNYTLGVLSRLLPGTISGSLSFSLTESENGTPISESYTIPVDSRILTWTSIHVRVPRGTYRVAFVGLNVTLSSGIITPGSEENSMSFQPSRETFRYTISQPQAGDVTITFEGSGPNVVAVEYGDQSFWESTVNGQGTSLFPDWGFAVAAATTGKSGNTTEVTFLFAPIKSAQDGLVISLLTFGATAFVTIIVPCTRWIRRLFHHPPAPTRHAPPFSR